MIKLGKVVRKHRESLGLSQRDLASLSDLTPSFLSLVESDKRVPSLVVGNRIAQALNLTLEVMVWEAVEIPATASDQDRRLCIIAKEIIRQGFVDAHPSTDHPEDSDCAIGC